VDSKENAERMAGKHTLTYPILYGFDAGEIAASIGGYINEEPRYLQPSGFILRPDRTIAMLVQSSGAIGRLVANDTVEFIQYLQGAGALTPSLRNRKFHMPSKTRHVQCSPYSGW